jgi:hypothetical protein
VKVSVKIQITQLEVTLWYLFGASERELTAESGVQPLDVIFVHIWNSCEQGIFVCLLGGMYCIM